jgi:hypothetical protein
MRVVAAVVEGKDLARGIRISEHTIKVDHGVIFSTGADPRVDGLTLDLPRGRKHREWSPRHKKPVHRSQRAAENFQSFCMGTLDELPMALDDLLDGYVFERIQCRSRKDVVPP